MFAHLHNHTEYSMLDGLSRIDGLVGRAAELGMESLAITDHGGLHGAVEFYQACTAAGIKPVLGCETYVAHRSRRARTAAEKAPQHLTLLARNQEGYRNLLRLVTAAHTEGFYYKPRVDRRLLEQHAEGLVVLSGCPSAELPRLIIDGKPEQARDAAMWYRDTFEEFYVELQRHGGLPFQEELNRHLLELAGELGVPVVATNDCHYTHREEAEVQDLLVCIHTNTTIHDEQRLKMSDDSYYLRSPDEMSALFSDLPEALENAGRLAEKCNVELDFSSLHLPRYPVPEGRSPQEVLETECTEGLQRRIRVDGERETVEKRLRYELDVISEMGLANYFLVVWDIVRFARDRGILTGVRGSAAASIVLYALHVTDVDPLEYRLVFERFLNRERRELPDIDLDFQDDRRDEVMEYVVGRYGRDHVAQIITFGTLGAKAAIRDVGRALGMNYSDVDRVARLIPSGYLKTEQAEVKAWTIEEALARIPEFRELYDQDEVLRRLIDTARRLEGVVRHASTHAAGVVISERSLVDHVPLQRPVRTQHEELAMTQFAMGPIAALGLLKMDLLGLTNLTILDKARRLVEKQGNGQRDLRSLPLDDGNTFELLGSGETGGVFQLESAGMRRYVRELKPASLGDLAAMIALYRPGPMEQIDTFINARHGTQPIRYPHPTLQDILEETHGVIVYQEQVLLLLQAFAGYSLGEADIVRKAMGKKIADLMRRERERFVEGALRQGYERDVADQVFQLIEPFAGYAFNKAHAVSYALVAYWTAYFKANHRVEYMVALLNAHLGHAEKTAAAVVECHRLGIPVRGPDVNRSGVNFRIEREGENGEAAVRFGLGAIKNVGASAVEPLVEARAGGARFTTLEEFCRQADLQSVNRRTLESLIKVGALDSMGYDRGTLVANIGRIQAIAQRQARLRRSGQASMFDLFGDSVPAPLGEPELEPSPAGARERMAWEKELLGVYLSENPISAPGIGGKSRAVVARAELDAEMAGKQVSAVGQVSGSRRLSTRDGKPFLAATLEFMDGNVEVMVWPELLERTGELWQEGTFVHVAGKVRVRGDEVSISAQEASRLQEGAQGDERERPGTGRATGLAEVGSPAGERQEEASTGGSASGQPAERPRSRAGQQDPDQEVPDAEGATSSQRAQAAGPAGPRTLRVRLQETGAPEEDGRRFDEMLRALLAHEGEDPVQLEILTPGRRVTVQMDHLHVRWCAELDRELRQVLGGAVVAVEGVADSG